MPIQKASETFKTRILSVTGAKSVGKTTFVTSGSQFAPDVIPTKQRVDCSDVVFIQSDTNGALGAVSVGLEPGVIDLSMHITLKDWKKAFEEEYPALLEGFKSGQLRILGIDLSALDKMWRKVHVADAQDDSPKNWEGVAAEARLLYGKLRTLPNATIVGMSHINVAAEIASKSDPTLLQRQRESRDAQSAGGERAVAATDLSKSAKSVWWTNSDAILAVRRKKTGDSVSHIVRVHPSNKLEAGGRWESYFQAEEPAHLRLMMSKVYGDK